MPSPDDQVQRYEQLRQGAEALARLKPQEVRCLLLRAEGYSYRQICELTGWTYTKVNRCLTEGRRSFLEQMAGIESGAECARLAPLLSALADGEASAADLATLRPHLRSCLGCRAALRAFRELPHRAAELAPVPAAAGAEESRSGLAEWLEPAIDWAQERAGLIAAKAQAAVEGSSAGKAAAVAASAAALAGGAAAVDRSDGHPARTPPPPVAQAEPLIERAMPLETPQPVPAPPVAPEVAPPPLPSPAPAAAPQAPPPAPLPPSYTPPAQRSDEFPERLATPVTEPGQSALAGAEEEERRIEPMTRPAEPPPGRPDAEPTSADGQAGVP